MKSKGEIANMQSIIDGLMRQLEGKDHMIQHLLDKVDELESTIKDLSNNIEKMTGVTSTYERRLYGTSSEKSHIFRAGMSRFNMTDTYIARMVISSHQSFHMFQKILRKDIQLLLPE